MTLVNGSDRIVETENCDPLAGEVRSDRYESAG